MAFSGTKNERKEFKKQVGVGEFEVVAINPDSEKLKELWGVDEIKKEPEYEGEKDGYTTLKLTFYLKEVRTGSIFNVMFFLQDKEVVNKVGDKHQYLNSIGRSTWVEDESKLNEKFK